MNNKDVDEVMKVLDSALCDERKCIIAMLGEMQVTVSQFATIKECTAYNRALRDAAQMVLDLNEAVTAEE
mgnify:CR=1 FL=1|tara:strand:+ start:265 stop:474 length:210 start_codon:yes stop_codon:yes gene_type:complete